MGGEWRKHILEDIAANSPNAMSTGPFGSAISSKFFLSEGVPVIRGGNLSTDISYKMSDEGLVFVSEEKALEFQRSIVRPGDIIFTCWGTINQVGLITEKLGYSEYIISNKQMKFTPDQTRVDSLFLYYLFSGPAKQLEIIQNGIGAAVPGFNLGQLKQHIVNLPSIEEQKIISGYLGSLDDKIELNRQMNATLESMAQALFKSWFVDFDQVIDNALAAGNPIPEPFQARAKTRKALGDKRKPLPEAIQQQFPSSFVFTEEMGWIPGGWSFARFLEAAHVVMGQSPAGDTYNSDGKGTPLVNGPVEFAEYFVRKSKWTTAPSKCCNVGDLIVCVRGSTTGRYVKADGEYCLGRGVCAIQGKISQVFADQTYKANIDLLLLMTTGSTFPNWSGPTLNNFPIVLPPNHMLRLFEDQAGRITRKIGSNCIQNDMLSQLRDTLLPKLLSGQLRIPDAEKIMADAL